jgi:hypothetical protein
VLLITSVNKVPDVSTTEFFAFCFHKNILVGCANLTRNEKLCGMENVPIGWGGRGLIQ